MTRVKSILYGSVATIALAGLAPAAHAADMSVKAPVIGDLGVSFYGQLDLAAMCFNHGTPLSGNGLPDYFLFSTPNVNQSMCAIAGNAITQSLIGVKVEKSIGYGFTAIADFSTGFNPWSGELSSAVGSVARANASLYGNAPAFGDGGRDGQFLNGPVFAGLSSAAFGTLTAGRISTLQRDNVLAYDPQGGAYAFSMIGFYGAFAGMGNTEDAYWDNAVKYVYDGGPFHFGAAASSGAPDASQQGAYAFDAGLHNVLGGLSIDAAYGNTKDGVGYLAPFGPQVFGGNPQSICAQCLPLVGLESQAFTRISDNQAWSVQGKYVFNLAGWGSAQSMYTKAAPAPATFTLYAGWEHVEQRDPTHQIVNGSPMVGAPTVLQGYVNNYGFLTPQLVDQFWVGGKLAVNNWTLTGAYYYQQRNSWDAGQLQTANAGIGVTQPQIGTFAAAACNGATVIQVPFQGANKNVLSTNGVSAINLGNGANCAGSFQSASFVADYAFNKYVDIYSGVNWNTISGGYTVGTQWTQQVSGITGLRFKF